jgi:hypothetical protein
VELIVLEPPLRLYVADTGSLLHGQDAVVDDPLRGGVVLRGNPLVEVRAVEEMDCIGGRSLVGRARRDNRRLRGPDLGLFRLRLRSSGLEGVCAASRGMRSVAVRAMKAAESVRRATSGSRLI